MQEELVFKAGKEVRVVWNDTAKPETKHSMRFLVDGADINSLYLNPLEGEGNQSTIPKRTEVSVFISLDNGSVAEYASVFEGVEVNLLGPQRWVLRYPYVRVSSARGTHRRRQYRLDIAIPFFFEVLLKEGQIPINYPHKGDMVNLSAGGLRGYVPIKLKQGDQLEIMFALPPYRIIARGNVAMAVAMDSAKGVTDIGVSFAFREEDRTQEEHLARFILQEQFNRRESKR